MKKKKTVLLAGAAAIISIAAFGIKIGGKGEKNKEMEVETALKKGEYRKISAGEAKKMMETEKGYKIVDVRSQDEYNEGHIPNAVSLPLENIAQGKLADLPDKEQLILLYCRSGNRSRQAALKLIGQGYVNVIDFGGTMDWTGEIVR